MGNILFRKKLSSFQIIILGFLAVILVGAFLLMLPVSAKSTHWTSFEDALFTATSAVCVTGLIVKDTATYWSYFGQAIIFLLIQIGGLGIVSIAAFISYASGRKISLLQRNMLQESISSNQVGGVVRMTIFIFKLVFIIELLGAIVLLPTFCKEFGVSGIWMAFFHSVSAFCNAGFDIMGNHSGAFSSLTSFSSNLGIVIPICLLIIVGGIGFFTWDDILVNKFHFKKYRIQSKVIFTLTAILIFVPAIIFFFNDFSASPMKDRISLSFFQAVTPRTAGFNTANLNAMSGVGKAIIIILMVIGGSPGSTAGGMKTTTIAVLFANVFAVLRRKKNAELFGRRLEDQAIKTASTLLLMYIFLTFAAASVISAIENISFATCIFETASAIGTVGLSLGITPSLGLTSHLILIVLMFFGRVGGLTLMYAAINSNGMEVSQRPVEKINVG